MNPNPHPGPGPQPYTSRLELAALADAPSWARRHAREVLQAWNVLGEPAESAVLAVSELITNAVKYGGTPEPDDTGHVSYVVIHESDLERVVLTLWKMPGRLLVEVFDSHDRPPVPNGGVSWDQEGGRGLHIVQSVAKQWGFYQPPTGGKVVWAEISLT